MKVTEYLENLNDADFYRVANKLVTSLREEVDSYELIYIAHAIMEAEYNETVNRR